MNKVLNHVAIIMDGNGRWATERNKKRSYGHKEGFNTLRKLSRHIFRSGVKVLSVYAFSTENFKREKEEVDFLMNLFLKSFKILENELMKEKVKIIFSGRKEPLNDKVYKEMKRIEKNTEKNDNAILNVCLNYGGHAEIIDASKKITTDVLNNKLDMSCLDEKTYNKYLYNELPPIDLLIRTGGELRVSNFMLWQLAYAEFYFTDTYFPDFNESEYDKAVESYNKRDRRFGGVNKK